MGGTDLERLLQRIRTLEGEAVDEDEDDNDSYIEHTGTDDDGDEDEELWTSECQILRDVIGTGRESRRNLGPTLDLHSPLPAPPFLAILTRGPPPGPCSKTVLKHPRAQWNLGLGI